MHISGIWTSILATALYRRLMTVSSGLPKGVELQVSRPSSPEAGFRARLATISGPLSVASETLPSATKTIMFVGYL